MTSSIHSEFNWPLIDYPAFPSFHEFFQPIRTNLVCLLLFFRQRHLICLWICENLEFGIREIIMRTLKNSFWIPPVFLVIMITSLITLNVVQITKYDNFWVKLLENPHAFFWKQLPKVFKLSIRKCVNPFIIIEWPEDWLTYRPFPAKFDYKNLQL